MAGGKALAMAVMVSAWHFSYDNDRAQQCLEMNVYVPYTTIQTGSIDGKESSMANFISNLKSCSHL